MTARPVIGVGAIAALALVVSVTSMVPAGFAADPAPTAVPLTVVIPGPSGTATPTPTPTPTPSRSTGTGGGTGSGGSTGTGSGTGQLPTEADGSPIPPTSPTPDADGLEVDRESVPVGEWIVATGTGFAPGEKVQFVLYPGVVIIGSFVADANGTVVARFRITENARAGEYTVEATGWQSFHVANTTFQVVGISEASPFPWLWWVYVVVGVILLSILAAAIYFRRLLAAWFAGARPTGSMP